jgi:hypothetical protein
MKKKIVKSLTSTYADTQNSFEREIIAKTEEINAEIQKEIQDFYKKYDLPKYDKDGNIDVQATNDFLNQKVSIGEKVRITKINKLQADIGAKIGPIMLKRDKRMEQMAEIMAKIGYYSNSWALSQETGVNLMMPALNDNAIKSIVQDDIFSIWQAKGRLGATPSEVSRKQQIMAIQRKLETSIVSGMDNIAVGKEIDKILGFRDAQGELLTGVTEKRGIAYQSLRIIRTESLRAYNGGHVQEMSYAKSEYGIDSRLRYVAALDDRTRPQSASMDGQISDEQGRFRYPDGNYYFIGRTGNPAWDINDRCTTVPEIVGELPPDVRETQGNGLVPYTSFTEWAKDKGLEKNIYGQRY